MGSLFFGEIKACDVLQKGVGLPLTERLQIKNTPLRVFDRYVRNCALSIVYAMALPAASALCGGVPEKECIAYVYH